MNDDDDDNNDDDDDDDDDDAHQENIHCVLTVKVKNRHASRQLFCINIIPGEIRPRLADVHGAWNNQAQ